MEIKVNFDEFAVREQRTPTLVKILMLKGEKGDRGTTDYNDLTNKPTALSDFYNDGVFITNAAADLVNYYKKSETYTQTEINNLVAAIPKFAIAVVNTLPVTDISTTTVYLVPSNSDTSDIYKEYIYVNNTWELLGIQKTDLTDYYTKTQTDTLLAAKANSSTVSSLTSQVNDNTDNISGLTTTVAAKADQSTVNAISSQVTTNTNDIAGLTTTVSGIIDAIYPVGAIYMSVNNTSPQTLFGGTWAQIQDRFLLAAGSTYTAGSTGGAATHSHTTADHTLTVSEIPSHSHTFNSANDESSTDMWCYTASYRKSSTGYTDSTGGGQSHNHGDTGSSSNMPPYMAVYMWQRTA